MTNRSWWGWGDEEAHLDAEAISGLVAVLREQFATTGFELRSPASISDLTMPAPRLEVPSALDEIVSVDPDARARHAHGQSFRDVVRAFHGELDAYPDAVASPRDEADVASVLDWCAEVTAACIPYGGGTSVVGGVNPVRETPTVTLDTTGLAGVHEIDEVSRAARIGAGTTGPDLEEALRAAGLTMRFYPQSWEFSTVGGWIATRAGGHDATMRTHVDDLVESIRAVTPRGIWSSRRLPASGAGPSPDRLLLGSEGVLGVITEAWIRVRPRPTFRANAAVTFPDFATGCHAVRAIVQAELYPSNCRLLDPLEAMISGAGDGEHAVLLLGFESSDHPLHAWMERAVEIARDHGGTVGDEPRYRQGDRSGEAEGTGGTWRETFLRAPYLRDALVAVGAVVETFESAITWERLDEFVSVVGESARSAAEQACGAARVALRLTHAYPDGAAPYWTVIAPGRRGAEVAQWDTIKAAVSEAILAGGGTITHHHAVGRDHRPWYAQQRPVLFGEALAATKSAVDPAGIMNPGALI